VKGRRKRERNAGMAERLMAMKTLTREMVIVKVVGNESFRLSVGRGFRMRMDGWGMRGIYSRIWDE
jgi:hypothetical protein